MVDQLRLSIRLSKHQREGAGDEQFAALDLRLRLREGAM